MSTLKPAGNQAEPGAHGTAKLPARFEVPKWTSIAIGVLLLALAVNGLVRMDISWARIGEGPANIWGFITGAFPPNLERAPNLAEAMLETLEMAIIGTGLGVALSIPAAILAAQNTTPYAPIGVAMRFILTVLRSIPELVWALIFVMAVAFVFGGYYLWLGVRDFLSTGGLGIEQPVGPVVGRADARHVEAAESGDQFRGTRRGVHHADKHCRRHASGSFHGHPLLAEVK